jgi:TPP-dependent pyruvate/acetoin dehydrogenase alpha subunit
MATNGMDVLQVYEICEDLISRIRAGYGPIFLECKTYRFKGHSKSDPRVYRSRKEEQLYKSKCPILKLRTDVINNSIADQSDLDELERNVQFQIDRAYENALNYPHPDVTEAMQDVFCE